MPHTGSPLLSQTILLVPFFQPPHCTLLILHLNKKSFFLPLKSYGCGYAAHVEFMDNPKTGLPTNLHNRLDNAKPALPTYPQPLLLLSSLILKTLKEGISIRHLFLEFMLFFRQIKLALTY